MLHNIFAKIKNLVITNKYAFFVLSLIILVISGSVISWFIERNSITNTSNVEKVEQNLPEQSSSSATFKAKKVVSEFNVKVPSASVLPYNVNVSVKKGITPSNINDLESSLYSYSFVNRDEKELSQIIGLKEVSVSQTSIGGKTIGDQNDFRVLYLKLLNSFNSATSNLGNFNLELVAEQGLELVGDEYHSPEAFSITNPLHIEYVFAIYFNGHLVSDKYGQTTISAIYDKYNKEVRFSAPKIFPASVELLGYTNISASEYIFVPKLLLDATLASQVIDSGIQINASNFQVDSTAPTVVYIFDAQENVLVPQVALKGALVDVPRTLNDAVYFLPQ